jgi:hypothetical protein
LGRLGALVGVDDRVTRARLSPSRLADRDIKRLVDTVQRAIPIPKIEMRRAFRRQIFRQSLPLAAGREHIEDSVEVFALVDRPTPSAAPGRRNERSDQHPLGVAQVTRITKAAAAIGKAMFGLPHAGAPVRIMTFATELQPIHPTQEVLGSASEAGGEKSAKSSSEDDQILPYIPARREAGSRRSFNVTLEPTAILTPTKSSFQMPICRLNKISGRSSSG